jgi:transposase
MSPMNPLTELAHLNLDPDAKTQVAAVVQTLLEQAQRDAETLRTQEAELQAKNAEIQAKDLKIQVLTLELAHIKRMRYCVKSEALAPLQRDVFEETWHTDLAAIEAEIEQLADDQSGSTIVKFKRPRAGRQPLPDHLPRIEHRHEPEACTCGQCGKDLVKIGEE